MIILGAIGGTAAYLMMERKEKPQQK